MNYAIILAAGQGQRMNSKEDKLMMMAGGYPVIYHSLMILNDHPAINEVLVVANKINKDKIEKIIKDAKFGKIKKTILGGLTRQQSLGKAFASISKSAQKEDLILVHNAASPMLTLEEISQTLAGAQDFGACVVGHSDQLLETPQVAKYPILKKAIEKAEKDSFEGEDEFSLIKNLGEEVSIVEANKNNFKITNQGDYKKLKLLMGDLPSDIRVGVGQDSHKFDDKNMGLKIGGLLLKDHPQLLAKTDGDVVLHAIFNALSQALGDMSLSFYSDKLCEQGVLDSSKYLGPLLKRLKKEKLEIRNLALMIECKKPKIDPLAAKLKKSIAEILGVNTRKIGVAATGSEDLTVFGAGLGIQCFAIISLRKSD
jgi:2-C-methyl-D-erythritol 2,4-cyclodiphosphate synthase